MSTPLASRCRSVLTVVQVVLRTTECKIAVSTEDGWTRRRTSADIALSRCDGRSEHVIALYRRGNFRYQVGSAAGVLQADPDADMVDIALELAWAFVESGSPPAEAKVKAIVDNTSEPPTDMDRDQMALPALAVLDAIEALFEAVGDETPEATVRVLDVCENAVGDMFDGLDVDEDKVEGYCEKEASWQRQVIERVRQNGDKPLSRALLANLLGKAPAWHKHLDDYADLVN